LKRIVLSAVLAVLLAPQLAAEPWLKSVAAAQKKAKETNRLIFVDLFADWCGWCHRMEREVFPSEAFQKATANMVLLRVDTEDGGEGSQLARQFQATQLPTFLLLTPDMTIAGLIKGYAPAPTFVKVLDETYAKYKDFLKKVKSEATFAKDYTKRLDLAREFTSRHAFKEGEKRLQAILAEKGVPPAIRDQAYYDLAVSQYLQLKYDDSLKTIRSFTGTQSKGEPVERAHLLASDIYLKQGNLLGAANELRQFKASFPNSQFLQNVNMMLPAIERTLAAKQ
jgi:thioredoxin-related protein